MKKLTYFLLGLFLFYSCKDKTDSSKSEKIIQQQVQELETGIMTPETLWYFGRISDVKVSADNKKVLFGVTFYDIDENKGNRELFVLDIETKEKTQITKTPFSEHNAVWHPVGEKITFLYPDANGAMQIFKMNDDGSNRTQISNIEGGITGFKFSPSGDKICYSAEVKVKPALADIYPALPKANARIIDELMYRHWDKWVSTYSHIFIADFDGNNISESMDIMKDEPWGAPVSPFGGMEQIAWHPDGSKLVYTSKKIEDLEYSLSTNADLYMYDLNSGETTNITKGMMGYDANPVFSPDGNFLAWESLERQGYESDKHRLFILNLKTNEKTYLTQKFDSHVYSITWAHDNKTIYFISDWFGTKEIFSINIEDKNINKITEGIHDYTSLVKAGNVLIAEKQSMSKPTEIYIVNINTGKDTEISLINKELLGKINMGRIEKKWITTTDNKEILTWIIYPPNFDSTKTYPALLYCQGGPQSMVSQFWSYRWNFQMMAAHGYIIVAPNRRGVTGFGKEWLEQISGDYGGQNVQDLLSAIDELAKEPYVDNNNLGAVGASYGGFSVFHLAGMHNKRFSAFISHCGIFNYESMYLETEELWFVNWDLGGPYWKKDKNPVVKRSYEASPHHNAHKWDTPILIIHGERDFRISFTQSMQAFNAAKINGVPARLLLFPEENHWVLSPQNAILWQREFFGWLDKYLKFEV